MFRLYQVKSMRHFYIPLSDMKYESRVQIFQIISEQYPTGAVQMLVLAISNPPSKV